MAKRLDKQAIFEWLHHGAATVQRGLEKGIQKSKDISEAINAKIEDNPKAKAIRDNVSEFARDKSEKLLDMRINGVRIGDFPDAAQRLTERQVYKLLSKIHKIDPDANWNQYFPNPEDMPIFGAFECLGLPYGTPFEEVKKTYRRLMREYHPDRHADSPEEERIATQKTQEITAAYELISKHYGK